MTKRGSKAVPSEPRSPPTGTRLCPLADAVVSIPTIHHLQWHGSPSDHLDEAADLFHAGHHDHPDTLEEDTFDRIYGEVATINTDDLKQLFGRSYSHRWYNGAVKPVEALPREGTAVIQVR